MKNAVLLLTLLTGCSTVDYHYVPTIEGHLKAESLYKRIDAVEQPMFKIQAEDEVGLVSYVNNFVNTSVTYKPDNLDYWQSAYETATRKTGDCEDFAIYKMQLLAFNGIPDKDMFILTGDGHAVLTVRQEYYLDNNSTTIYGNPIFKPSYMINRAGYAVPLHK